MHKNENSFTIHHLISQRLCFRRRHYFERYTHTPAPHFSLFIKKKDSKGGDRRGAMCNNSPWLPTPENTRKPTNWATRKKKRQSSRRAISRHSFNFLRGRSASFRRLFVFFSPKSLREALFALAFFAEQLFYFLSFFPRNVFGKLLFLRPRQATHAPPICCCTFPTASSYGYGASIVMAPRKRGRRPKTHFPPHTHTYFVCLDSRTEKALSLRYRDTSLRPSPPSSRQRLRASSLLSSLRPSQMIPLLFS